MLLVPAMSVANEMTIGGLAGARPASIKVFQRFGIDFCCGGRKSLAEACAAKGIDPANVLKEISREEDACALDDRDGWTSRPTEELLSLLVRHYHPRLRDDLARLQGLAVKVLRVHGSKDPERLHALATAIVDLKEELEPHLDKEEQVLFPMIRSGPGPCARQPIEVMSNEHVATAELLAQIRMLTENYAVPKQACATWRALWEGLEQLDLELQEHLHLENNILFPRALAGA